MLCKETFVEGLSLLSVVKKWRITIFRISSKSKKCIGSRYDFGRVIKIFLIPLQHFLPSRQANFRSKDVS